LLKRYYSERQGRGPKGQPLPLEALRRLVVSVFDDFNDRDYLQESLGFECVDAGYVDGQVGPNPASFFFRTLMRDRVYPWDQRVSDGESDLDPFGPARRTVEAWTLWDVDTTFDMIEVLHDLVSKPLEGHYHSWNDCGYHYSTFDRIAGQREFREEINKVLRLGDPAYELDDEGHIVERVPDEFGQLLAAPVPPDTDPELITSRIDAAVVEFRTRGATIDDRRHAVRDLADVLEVLRADVREHMLTADEKAIYHLANGFSIRHNNREQKGDYDRLTWLRWAFYVYLATIHALLRVRAAGAMTRSCGCAR
jgi:hypothetical protein